jgi:hypothetical protein
MPDIGILGGGVGGSHLGLFRQQHGMAATIYSAKTPAEHLSARLTNVVCRNGRTRARERALGVDFWMPTRPIWNSSSSPSTGRSHSPSLVR